MKVDKPMQAVSGPLVLKSKRQVRTSQQSQNNDATSELYQAEQKDSEISRTERLKVIKEQVTSGSYYVDPYLVADKFLRGTLIGFS